ncbi:unnamed protein product [Arctogadus glacialis]
MEVWGIRADLRKLLHKVSPAFQALSNTWRYGPRLGLESFVLLIQCEEATSDPVDGERVAICLKLCDDTMGVCECSKEELRPAGPSPLSLLRSLSEARQMEVRAFPGSLRPGVTPPL